jgi:hypothetical protein
LVSWWHPHRILDTEPDKPAKQQVVVDPLDQLPLRADRIERLQQQRSHQPFRPDRLVADRANTANVFPDSMQIYSEHFQIHGGVFNLA